MLEDLNILLLTHPNHLKTKIGNFEWQVISGRLESSGYLPANSDSNTRELIFMCLK